jgi:hypothetical protein
MPSASTPPRLFYLPRCLKGAPTVAWSFRSDNLLKIEDLERVSRSARARQINPFTEAGRSMAGDDKDTQDLKRWAVLLGARFDPVAWLERYAPDTLYEERSAGGWYTVCPHFQFEGKHSNSDISEAPAGSYVEEPASTVPCP